MITVTENWSGWWMSHAPPWRARREFTVSGTTDGEVALTAQDESGITNLKIPRRQDRWRDGSLLQCVGPVIKEWKGPDYVEIVCEYTTDVFGDPTLDPLARPPQYEWSPITRTFQTSVDLDGHFTTNSSGELFPYQREIVSQQLTVVRMENEFDVNKSQTYSNTANIAPMTIAGKPVKIEHCLCREIRPGVRYDTTTYAIPIVYTFEIVWTDTGSDYPFQTMVPDVGKYGFYTKNGVTQSGRFVSSTGGDIGRDVPLDGDGLPLLASDQHLKIDTGSGLADPVENPNPLQFYKYVGRPTGNRIYYKSTALSNLYALQL